MTYPQNTDDLIDSRDVIEAITELTENLADQSDVFAPDELADMRTELAALVALADEAAGYAADWEYGETLIRDSHFTDYARELADDIGAIPSGLSWPMTCIDWEQAVRELRMDYTSVDFDGITYWVR